LQKALDDLATIDNVLVERFGTGSSSSQYGFTYSIYFTGNALHIRNAIESIRLPILQPNLTQVSCVPFAYFTEGTVKLFTTQQAKVITERIRSRGYNLYSTTTTAEILTEKLIELPTFINFSDVRRTLKDDQNGYIWTFVFDISMGNAPTLVCGMNSLLAVSGICTHHTIIEGNYIGGYFIIGTSNLLPSDISAYDMQIELQLLEGFGNVSVSRIGPDNQGGYTWTVTWLTIEGDIAPLQFVNALTGSGATINGTTIKNGNALGGYYILEFDGKVTPSISYSASAYDLQSALASIVGGTTVTKSIETSEGGAIYKVTFLDLNGDIALLNPQYDRTLTGVGAVVKVIESVKGALALGSTLKLSFESPLQCSHSQVVYNSCGSPIDKYSIEVGDSKGKIFQVINVNADYSTQYVRIQAISLYDYNYFLGMDATGSFQLSYNGVKTNPISSYATAQDMRDVIEALPDVNTVYVERSYSADLLEGEVSAITGIQYLTCVTECNFNILPPGELIRVGSLWYKVAYNYDGSLTRLPLAKYNDSSIITSYEGTTDNFASLYRWARGYEWEISFLSVNTIGSVLPLESPKHRLNPLDAAVSIRPLDCIDCTYVSGLSVLTSYYLGIRAHNEKSYGTYSYTTGTPNEIPGAPNAVSVRSVSGTQLEVFFSPPSGVVSDIVQYSIQWDHTAEFSNVTTDNPSCTTSGYGVCELTGATISVVPPFRYLINNLMNNEKYYVRVAARNPVSFQTVYTSINDPTRWSEIVSATTSNQVPSAPIAVVTSVSGPTSLQVLISPPTSNGGLSIDKYSIEWFSSDSKSKGSVLVTPSSLPELDQTSGILVYELLSLLTGVNYNVKVSAQNSIGSSPYTQSAVGSTPASKPQQPSSVMLSTASSQDTSITSTNVTWIAPTGSNANGGSPITGYLVEWWQTGSVPEVQVIEFTSATFPIISSGQFKLSFGPLPGLIESTGTLLYNSSSYNIRSELMNLGYSDGLKNNYTFSDVIGDIRVSRSIIPDKGYQWSITFVSIINTGNQVKLVGTSLASSLDLETINVIEVVPGQRNLGTPEIQIINILSEGSTSATDLGGWFTLSFKGVNLQTTYLSVSASAYDVQQALLQLNTIRQLQVTRSNFTESISSVNYAGYSWTITFLENVGDQAALVIDKSLLYTTKSRLIVSILDGDNSLSPSYDKLSDAFPGESPKGYNSITVDKDTRSYTINQLIPGNTYYVAVSAINSFGIGPKLDSDSTTPVIQAPQPPSNVTVSVHPGSSSTLDVTYKPPISDGGSSILSYRVELDITPSFTNPIYNVIPCAAGSTYSVFQITTSGSQGNPISSGYFQLVITRNRQSFITDYISYDAVASLSDEEGIRVTLADVTATLTRGSDIVVASSSVTQTIFVNDYLQFPGQLYPKQIFKVIQVSGVTVTLSDKLYLDSTIIGSTTSSVIYRIYGGRGTVTTSRLACTAEASICPLTRRQNSGSMEAKIESIPEAVVNGVTVDRDDPDIYNGVTWRVTFLDDSLPGTLNFDIAVLSNNVKTIGGTLADIVVKNLVKGETYTNCVGTHQVPKDKALANGQYYYARVFAYNEIGYSLPQISASAEKPHVVPGLPTSVILSVVSDTELNVSFNPPADDGGDTITSYQVDYSINSNFDNYQSVFVRTGNAPFSKTISGLSTGIPVYVRVSAANSQGYGDTTPSIPPYLNPYQPSDAPSNVILRATSDSLLTVAFSAPLNNGGDSIVSYRVEWDTTPTFNGGMGVPHKGFVILDATQYSSYTIQYLLKGRVYYVRVFAINSAGPGTPALSSPSSLAPSLQVPGKPHTISALTGLNVGEISVSWQRPKIPWHNIPCSGLPQSPNECPSGIGGGIPLSNGGSPITEYEISYNDLEDFSGLNHGDFTTTLTTYTLQNLIPDRTYYIRVLARNQQGAGKFCQYEDSNCLIVSRHVSAKAKATLTA